MSITRKDEPARRPADVPEIVAEAERKGEQAKQLLEHPILQAAFARLEKTYIETWRTSDPSHDALREHAYFRLQCLDELRADLESVANGGRVAAFNHRLKR